MSRSVYRRHIKSTNVRMKKAKRVATAIFMATAWRVAPMVVRMIVSNTFFTPRRRPLSEAQMSAMEKAERFRLQVHDKSVACWKWGQGPSILLAHGWNGKGVDFHRFIEPISAAGYSAIAFDAPGHGDSEGRTSSYFQFTDTVRAVLNSEKGKSLCGIVAHSVGGSAAINAVDKEGLCVKMVLVAPALKLKEMLYGIFDRYGIPGEIYRSMIADYERRYGYDLERDNPYDLAGRIQSEVLIVQDEYDELVSFRDAERLAGEQPHVSLFATKGLGHNGIMLDSAAIDKAIAFLCK